MAEEDGFLSRWSRRKQLARAGQPLAEVPSPDETAGKPVPAAVPAAVVAPVATVAAAAPVSPASPATQAGSGRVSGGPGQRAPDDPPEPVRLPTLDDVAQLTPEADFSPFVARGVPSDVKNAALKKLFTDPRYNIMDGMDVYIDDYSQPNPLPLAMARKLASAKFMQLFDEPDEPGKKRAVGAPHGTGGSTDAELPSAAAPAAESAASQSAASQSAASEVPPSDTLSSDTPSANSSSADTPAAEALRHAPPAEDPPATDPSDTPRPT